MKRLLVTSFVIAALAALTTFGAVAAVSPVDALSLAFDGGSLPAIGLAGLVLNRASIADMSRGFKTLFQNAFSRAKPDHDLVAMRVPSTTSEEKYAWLGKMFSIREWLGSRVIQNLSTHNFTIVNKTFEGTVAVPSEAVKDDQYGIYGPMFTDMGDATAKFPCQLVFPLLKAGFTGLCYDGQYFFDSDHPVYDPATEAYASVSNTGGGAGTAWFLLDLSRPIKPIILQVREEFNMVNKNQPTDDNVFFDNELIYGVDGRMNVGYGLWQIAYGSKATLDATSFDAAVAAMMAFKGDHGKPLGIKPTHLVTAPANRAAANLVLNAERLASGATNTNFKAVELVISPWLA